MIKSAKWLHEHLNDDNLIILDGSLESKKHRSKQIEKSRFFDLKGAFSEQNSPFPNTIPSVTQFELEARKLGINSVSIIVVYDNYGIYSAARVWYLFRSMGHMNVYVLDGGLPEWEKQGYPIEESRDRTYESGDFQADYNTSSFKTIEQVLKNISSKESKLTDARSAGRFKGTDPEPRKEIKSGSIPGSINIPFTEVLEDGKFKSKVELQEIMASDKPVIYTCGSGVTACILLLASEIAEVNVDRSVFDGSWTEWAINNDLLV